MKKQILNLGKALNKAEQKLINGGNPGGLDDAPGTCGYISPEGSVWCNISKSQAKGSYENMGGNWCCDSCGTTSYCS